MTRKKAKGTKGDVSCFVDFAPFVVFVFQRSPLTQSQPHITGTTHTLPFDKFSSRDFERLCLWLVEREGIDIDWEARDS